MGKVSITINGLETNNVYPAFTIGVSAAASGDEVIFFVLPSAMPVFVGDKIKELNDASPKSPDLVEMWEGLKMLNAQILVCELGFDVNDLEEKDLIDGCEVVGATTFVARAQGSDLTFSF
ncbi:MAG: DsrE/DsrF/DrsH-like family protein [Candidatus Cloacimonadota bacterium]|nr:DsrE/DsrF/DrsH-like family protein [Candidatus Cloacimonadota bacterium]